MYKGSREDLLYIRDGGASVREWDFECGAHVVECRLSRGLSCVNVYERDSLVGSVVSGDADMLEQCIAYSLDAGECPLCAHWDDGCGNILEHSGGDGFGDVLGR